MAASLSVLEPFFFSVLIGLFIGAEREYAKGKDNMNSFGGIRTFLLISILGGISGYFSTVFNSLSFLFIPFIIVSLFVLVDYFIMLKNTGEPHSTTAISALLVFILSSITFYGLKREALALSILIASLLHLRNYLHRFIRKITKKELNATLTFAIITLIVLPFLPNRNYGPFEVFNPYLIWLMVIFVSSISFIGYVLVKLLGSSKGMIVTGILGGIMSSTAATLTFSERSKNMAKKFTSSFALGIVLAATATFFITLFEVIIVNQNIAGQILIGLFPMMITGLGVSYYHLKIRKHKYKQNFEFKSPFTLPPAIKFGLFFIFILFLSKSSLAYLGNTGVYLTSILSGFGGIDAITLTMARLSSEGSINSELAVTAIMLGVLSNLIVKSGIVYLFAAKELKKKVLLSFGAIFISGIIGLLLV